MILIIKNGLIDNDNNSHYQLTQVKMQASI